MVKLVILVDLVNLTLSSLMVSLTVETNKFFLHLGATLSSVKFLVQEQLGVVLADQISTMRNCRTIEDHAFLPRERD